MLSGIFDDNDSLFLHQPALPMPYEDRLPSCARLAEFFALFLYDQHPHFHYLLDVIQNAYEPESIQRNEY